MPPHFKLIALIGIILYITSAAQGQQRKIYSINFTEKAPQIDGKLDDPCWQKARVATNFLQMEPYNGKEPTDATHVRMLYGDAGVFISAKLEAKNHRISKKFTKRDEEGLTDHFYVLFDPFNDGLNGFVFKVTTQNVQIDIKYTSGNQDKNWDAVWKSATKVYEDYWQVEMRIPYSELRFPLKNKQTWAVNFFRNMEANRELVSWNYVDLDQNGLVNQSGITKGMKGLEPPTRLSFMPYVSGYLNKQGGSGETSYSLKGGADLKYGINQSFTLDMMLIPDFGQVQEDDEVLNLSPFETYYSEKRQFFIEGNEMFNRAGIFYSRRIGGEPLKYNKIDENLDPHEKIVSNPEESQLINATKVTGKTPGGFGLGILNAMTLPTYAKMKDTLSGKTRRVRTQDFANYNVTSVEQSLKNNSYASIINTNKYIPGSGYMANTSGFDTELKDEANTYSISSRGAVSQIYPKDTSSRTGYFYNAEVKKISGKLQFAVSRRVESHTYNPNDMGYLQNNNEIVNSASLSYHINDPFGYFLNLHSSLYAQHNQLQKPKKFRQLYFNWTTYTTLKNHLFLRYRLEVAPIDRKNYDEARVDNRVFVEPAYVSTEIRWSSDYRKTLALDGYAGYYQANAFNQHSVWYGLSPRLQPANKLTLILNHRHSIQYNGLGYVDKSSNADTITFGKRKVPTMENTLSADYIINSRSSLNFRIRHYWSQVGYNKFYRLLENGLLTPYEGYNANENFSMNALNLQLEYTWNFAPGSELSIVWKNQVYNRAPVTYTDYINNLRSDWYQAADNNISVKLLYFIRYDQIKRLGQII